jgi:hypothetical protein
MQHMVENLLKKTTLKDLLRSQQEMQEWLNGLEGVASYEPAKPALAGRS